MAELQKQSQEEREREKETNSGGVGAKRQRRPSVRLGDIGGGGGGGDAHHHHYYYYTDQPRRRATKQNSKTRPLGNLKSSEQTLDDDINKINNTINKKKKKKSNSSGSGNYENNEDTKEGDFGDRFAIGNWKIRDLKVKRGVVNAKRARSNWASKLNKNHNQNQKCGNHEIDPTFQPVNSEDEEEEQDREQLEVHDNASPIHSFDNDDNDNDDDNGIERERERGDFRNGVQVLDKMEGPIDLSERNGVRVWLNKLGLGRYAPIFEIHEVDDQVLPLLTLDDLKDMGINAVGSRRKMYCSIQKLNIGFS